MLVPQHYPATLQTYIEVIRDGQDVRSFSRDLTDGRDSPLLGAGVHHHGTVRLHEGAVGEVLHHLDMTQGHRGLDQPLLERGLGREVLLVGETSLTTDSAGGGGGFLGLSHLASILITEDGEPSLGRLYKEISQNISK